MRWGGITGVRPSRRFWAVFPDSREDGRSVDEVEGVGEVDLQSPLVIFFYGVIFEDSTGCVYDGFRSSSDANAKLKRGESRLCVIGGFTRYAFGSEAPKRFPHGYRAVAARFLERGKQVAAAEIQ